MRDTRYGITGLLAGVAAFLVPLTGQAETVTFSGTVSYEGTHSGDSLYVAVLDTAVAEDVDILAIESFAVGAPPFDQPYSLDFDNDGVGAMVLVASFLDVDGGGLGDVSGADVFGWYAGTAMPTAVSVATSQSGLDFDLPLAEIRGTVTFAPDQDEASLELPNAPDCTNEGLRPRTVIQTAGSYAIVGIYAGSFCVRAEGSHLGMPLELCFGDPTCTDPTVITLGEAEVRTGVDIDFNAVPAERVTWGRIKSRHP